MDTKTCRDIIERGSEPLLLVDVRETEEIDDDPFFLGDHPSYVTLPLSVLAILPPGEITARLTAAASRIGSTPPETRIVLACRSGGRSSFAVPRLASLGIGAENLEGGRMKWGDPIK